MKKTTKDGHFEMTEEEIASVLQAQKDAAEREKEYQRELAIQALARKRLEEEYEKLTTEEKDALRYKEKRRRKEEEIII